MQSVYFLPAESRVTAGEKLCLTVCRDDYSLWYSLQPHRYSRSPVNLTPENWRNPTQARGTQRIHSPTPHKSIAWLCIEVEIYFLLHTMCDQNPFRSPQMFFGVYLVMPNEAF